MLYSRFRYAVFALPMPNQALIACFITSDNLLVKIIGTWEPREGSQQLYAASGIACRHPSFDDRSIRLLTIPDYMSPPLNFTEALLDPLHSAIYIVFMLVACAIFSKTCKRRFEFMSAFNLTFALLKVFHMRRLSSALSCPLTVYIWYSSSLLPTVC